MFKKFIISALAAISLTASMAAQAATTPTVSAINTEGFYGFRNIVKNSGFETALGTTFWTVSGGATQTTTSTAANVGRGSQAYDWDSNSAGQTLCSTAVAIPAGLYGRNGEASINLKCASGTCTHVLYAYDGSADISSEQTIVSSTTYQRTTVNFIYPSSGNIQLCLKSVASNEPELFSDDAYLGEARNVGSVAQAQFVGSAYIPTTSSCTWSRTNTAIGSFSTTSACPGPTVESNPGPGVIQTTDVDLPIFTVNNLPPGQYRVVMTVPFTCSGTSAYATGTISDGSTTSGMYTTVRNASSSNEWHNAVIEAFFNYTTAGNHSFEFQASATAGNAQVELTSNFERVTFNIIRLPNSAESAFRPDLYPTSWSGSQTVSGGCSSTSSTFADPSTCTGIALTELKNRNFGSVTTAASSLPGIIFTPQRLGRYHVCAYATVKDASGNASETFRLTDGTTAFVPSASTANPTVGTNATTVPLCGIYDATSLTATTLKIQMATNSGGTVSILNGVASGGVAITWEIYALDQAMPAPVLVGSATNSGSGAIHLEAAKLACSSSASITSQANGSSWVASIGNVSSGACAVTLTSGVFSATPYCWSDLDTQTQNQFLTHFSASTATAAVLSCTDNSTIGTACTTFTANAFCLGAR